MRKETVTVSGRAPKEVDSCQQQAGPSQIGGIGAFRQPADEFSDEQRG